MHADSAQRCCSARSLGGQSARAPTAAVPAKGFRSALPRAHGAPVVRSPPLRLPRRLQGPRYCRQDGRAARPRCRPARRPRAPGPLEELLELEPSCGPSSSKSRQRNKRVSADGGRRRSQTSWVVAEGGVAPPHSGKSPSVSPFWQRGSAPARPPGPVAPTRRRLQSRLRQIFATSALSARAAVSAPPEVHHPSVERAAGVGGGIPPLAKGGTEGGFSASPAAGKSAGPSGAVPSGASPGISPTLVGRPSWAALAGSRRRPKPRPAPP